MSDAPIGIVGGGRIARIILGGWRRTNPPQDRVVVVSDGDAAALERLRAEFPSVVVTRDNREAARQPIVLLGLHPPAFPAVLPEIAGSLAPDAILVSLAPKWTAARICGALGGFDRIARVIPNAPSIVNRGYNPVHFSARLTDADRARVTALFAPLGAFPEVAEETLEAYAIVAAMGPTYLWYQLFELIELGAQFGLPPDSAREAVTAMANGAIATMMAAGLPPDGVMDLIPVKPLAAIEPVVRDSYVSTLTALHQKLMP